MCIKPRGEIVFKHYIWSLRAWKQRMGVLSHFVTIFQKMLRKLNSHEKFFIKKIEISVQNTKNHFLKKSRLKSYEKL